MTEQQFVIPKIDPKVFKTVRQQVTQNKSAEVQKETPVLPIIVGAKGWPEIEGIELYYQNIPFPRKGFPDADIINALNVVKKDIVSYLLVLADKSLFPEYIAFAVKPWKFKIKTVNNLCHGVIRKANYWLEFWYYQPPYFCPFAQEIKQVFWHFLKELGIHPAYAESLSLIAEMFMEHDDRYRVVFQDLFSALIKEDLLNNPRKALKKVLKLLSEREHHEFTVQRIGSIFKVLSLALLHPKIKKAFKKAIRESDFKRLQFDKGDRYWAMAWGNYDSLGLNLEQRMEKRIEYHKGLPPTPYEHI